MEMEEKRLENGSVEGMVLTSPKVRREWVATLTPETDVDW